MSSVPLSPNDVSIVPSGFSRVAQDLKARGVAAGIGQSLLAGHENLAVRLLFDLELPAHVRDVAACAEADIRREQRQQAAVFQPLDSADVFTVTPRLRHLVICRSGQTDIR